MPQLKLPYYTSKDYTVMLVVMVPYVVVVNCMVFGIKYFSGWGIFLSSSIITAICGSLHFIVCGYVAVEMKQRFPDDDQLFKRLVIMIIMFLLLTALFLSLLFWGYEALNFYRYTFNQSGFTWAILSIGILNVFITFLMEGLAKFESWKASLKETEQLYMTYKQGQLMALKSQVNPHFLFNSLNTLSSLISDEPEEAEKFLDEISKVYRYMLRNDDDQLVSLSEELQFVHSYFQLLKARYGEAIKLEVNVDAARQDLLVPPLCLQVIMENALNQNVVSKSTPLLVSIYTNNENFVVIKNNIQPKVVTVPLDQEAGVDNLVNKYQLLNERAVVIKETATERQICLPLISKKEEVLA